MGESNPRSTNTSTDGSESLAVDKSFNGLRNEWSYSDEGKPLPDDFVPGPHDVICQRGKLAHSHNGNRHFRTRIKESLPRYSNAVHKWEKTGIVTNLVEMVKELSPSGGFVRKIGSKWHAVGDHVAREKVGQTMRDLLHDKYRSSTKSKAMKRRGDVTLSLQIESIPDQRKQHGVNFNRPEERSSPLSATVQMTSPERPHMLSALSEEVAPNDIDDGRRKGRSQQWRRTIECEDLSFLTGTEHPGTQRLQNHTGRSYPSFFAYAQLRSKPVQNTNPRDTYCKMKQIETDLGAALDALFPPPDVDALTRLSVASFESLLLTVIHEDLE